MSEAFKPKLVRCAIYTRKSLEDGLEQQFNSLDAQRESAEAYIRSQIGEGWVALPDRYDDGGVSGGTIERPALQRMLNDIEAGKVDCIVVYKVDRLSRSLMDFARMMEVLDRKQVAFVSVTQQFNTANSMGRLTLNILLSFAQFEREVIAERVRDKYSASKMKGMWMGGSPPMGYDLRDKKLFINEGEAEQVRFIYERFLKLGSATKLCQELRAQGMKTKSWRRKDGTWREGASICANTIRLMLTSRVYVGDVKYKDKHFKGQHEPIISAQLFERVQAIFKGTKPHVRAGLTRAKTPAPLKGIIKCGCCGNAMTPTFVKRKQNKYYRYYTCSNAHKSGRSQCPIKCVPAGEIEKITYAKLRDMMKSPEIVSKALQQNDDPSLSEEEIINGFNSLDRVWEELFPAEQSRILHLLIEKLEVRQEGLRLTVRTEGFHGLAKELKEGVQNAA
jgi:DNA invertase Pin-like site-specific DNA recombinase